MIQTFRKECAKYTYYQKHLHHLQLEYQAMEWKSYCVHSNDYEQKYDYRPVQYLSTVWLENKDKLEKEIQEIKAKIRWIETGFQCLEPSGDTLLESGEFSHSGSGEKRQFWSKEKSQHIR